METIGHILLIIHLFGFSAVAGGLISQSKNPKPQATKLAINGARLQLISGLMLYIVEPDGFTNLGLSLKTIGALIILISLEMHAKKPLSKNLYNILLIVLLAQVVVAVMLLEKAK